MTIDYSDFYVHPSGQSSIGCAESNTRFTALMKALYASVRE